MGGSYRRCEIISQSSPFSPFFISETTSIFPSKPLLSLLNPPFHFEDDFLDLLNPNPNPNLDFLDLIQIESETTPFCSHKRLIRRVESPESYYLKALCDRVSSLESKFDRALEGKKREEKKKKALKLSEVDRKYSYTAEIKGRVERKYQWTAEIEGVDEKKGKRGERKYKWSTEIKEKGDDDREKRIYTWKATIGGEKEKKKKDEVKKKDEKKKGSGEARIVEIEDEPDHRAVVLRQAFARRALAAKDKGKRKEISPEDAAVMIQVTFRGYLIRRSQVLRALRELAVAKSKLKELRIKFHNFSYRSHIARDAEERQKFSEKIIVLLLTVDSIEGVDMMVRAAKRSMVDELEAMLEVVDPQPAKRSLSMRRRMFDMPSGGIQKEIAEGVAQVVQMLNEEENGTFEACV